MEMTHNFVILPNKKIDVAKVLRESGKTKEECDQTIATTGIKTLCHAGDRLFGEFALSGLTKISKAHANIFIDVDAVSNIPIIRHRTLSAHVSKNILI